MKLESVNSELKYKQTVVIPFLSLLILIMMKVNLIQQMVSLPEGLYLWNNPFSNDLLVREI